MGRPKRAERKSRQAAQEGPRKAGRKSSGSERASRRVSRGAPTTILVGYHDLGGQEFRERPAEIVVRPGDTRDIVAELPREEVRKLGVSQQVPRAVPSSEPAAYISFPIATYRAMASINVSVASSI
jgi:hypothetical protein